VQQCRVLPQEASLVLGQVGQPIDVFLDALRLRLLLRRVLPIALHRLGTLLGLSGLQRVAGITSAGGIGAAGATSAATSIAGSIGPPAPACVTYLRRDERRACTAVCCLPLKLTHRGSRSGTMR
jgi:hypothetical protein